MALMQRALLKGTEENGSFRNWSTANSKSSPLKDTKVKIILKQLDEKLRHYKKNRAYW